MSDITDIRRRAGILEQDEEDDSDAILDMERRAERHIIKSITQVGGEVDFVNVDIYRETRTADVYIQVQGDLSLEQIAKLAEMKVVYPSTKIHGSSSGDLVLTSTARISV